MCFGGRYTTQNSPEISKGDQGRERDAPPPHPCDRGMRFSAERMEDPPNGMCRVKIKEKKKRENGKQGYSGERIWLSSVGGLGF